MKDVTAGQPRVVAIILLLVASLIVPLSVSLSGWWNGEDGGATFRAGLGAIELCNGDACRTRTVADLGGEVWGRMARLLFGLGFVASALWAVVAVVALRAPARLGRFWPSAAEGAALFLAGVGAFVVLRFPLEAHVGYTVALFYVAVAAALLGAGVLFPRPRG